MRVVLLGPPGSGKGTQGALLAQRLGLPKISTGDVLRAQAEAGTPLGIQARPHLDGGTLVPDEVTIGVVADRLAQPDTAGGFILDGFPRTLRQARDLGELLDGQRRPIDRVIEFRLAREDVIDRLAGRRTCGSCDRIWHLTLNPPPDGRCGDCGGALTQRADDRPDTIARRLDVYDRQTLPLADHYRSAGVLVVVDADGPVETVLAGSLAALCAPGDGALDAAERRS
ncbi:adenylate kinase [Hamadaea tsunoensis]|uniref:adenylate kinase n=1 Tax=Hamadaea tsunoensis TaxID=53368 RepID=UPI0004877370|nr:adenylate kinase [Hamadaea tsunoensis]